MEARFGAISRCLWRQSWWWCVCVCVCVSVARRDRSNASTRNLMDRQQRYEEIFHKREMMRAKVKMKRPSIFK